jgi:hypothetical protein
MEVIMKTGKDAAFRMREYRRRKREDKATHEDFMAFVAERDLELFLKFREKRAIESPPSEQGNQ